MTESSAGLERGYYLLNTDGGMASGHGRRRSGDPLGNAAIGALLRTPGLVAVDRISREIGRATHNEAEYRALIEGLKLARKHGIQRIRGYMDSELVVEQVNDRADVKQERLRELYNDATSLKALFKSIRVSWVPREMNKEADGLVREAFAVAALLREISREAADAILAGERPAGVRVADDYPTEFSAGMAKAVGTEGQWHYFVHRSEDDVVVGEIGAAFVDDDGTLEIGYAVVESEQNRGYATAAVKALVAKTREFSAARRIVAHTPLDRPESGRVLEKAGFAMIGETDDTDEDGTVRRVNEWELAL